MKSLIRFLKSKKAQLGIIEGKFFLFGLLGGIILALVIVYLANHGIIIPFKLKFLCAAVGK